MHLTVEVLIVREDRVLLRLHDKLNQWLRVGGHVQSGEDPPSAAVREAHEEVGLRIRLWDPRRPVPTDTERARELVPPMFMARVLMEPRHEHLTMTYFATSDSDDVVPSGPDVSREWRWATRADLEDPAWALIPSVKLYAVAALDCVGTGV